MEKADTNGTNGQEPKPRAKQGDGEKRGWKIEDFASSEFGMRNARSNSCRVVETFRAFTRRRPIPLALEFGSD
jgi:hypothetical protein